MKYRSTRGSMQPLAFSDVLLEGLAPDGGLAVPVQLPTITSDTLEAWRQLDYAGLATEVLALFIDDIPRDDLSRLVQATYQADLLGSPVVPLKPLDHSLSLLGLSNVLTFGFKYIPI